LRDGCDIKVATHGFVGGSSSVQLGDAWFSQAGLGRKNLRPYANLNFDPNDAISLAAGHEDERGDRFTASVTRDNRLHTGQQDNHAIAQFVLPAHQRLTLDTLYKTGNGDDGKIYAWGESPTYDFPRWFLRLAYYAKQNFSSADAMRVNGGVRF